MSNFRVKLDLSKFFSDRRRNSYVLMKNDWAIIEDLQKHIKELFDLPNIELMTTEDSIYLPPMESINIIHANDTIKVLRPSGFTVNGEEILMTDPCEEYEYKSAYQDISDENPNNLKKRFRKRKMRMLSKRQSTSNADHVYFNEDGEIEAISSKRNYFYVQESRKPKIVDPKVIKMDCDNISGCDIENNSKIKVLAATRFEKKPLSIEEALLSSTPLEGDPKVGDIILFKTPYKVESETFLTNYICGRVKSFDKKLECCQIYIIVNYEDVKRIEKKFCLRTHGYDFDHVYLETEEMKEVRLFKNDLYK